MKKLLQKLLSYSVYRKTLYTYAISIVIITTVILASVFGVLTSRIKNQTIETSQQLLTQLVSSADRARTDIENVMSVISSDSNTLRVIHSKEESKYDNYSLFLTLKDLKGFYSYIENIAVLNLNSNVCVQVMGDNKSGLDNINIAKEMVKTKEYILCRDIQISNKTRNVISFFQYFPYQNSGVIIDVNSDLFQYSISKENEKKGVVYIVDSVGNPVTKTARGYINNKLISQYLFEVVSNMDILKNSFVYDDTENKQMVFISKSQNLEWWFCDIQDYSYFYEDYQKISTIFIGITVVFLIITVITSTLFSKKMQKPLIQLVNKCRGTVGMDESFTEDEWLYIDKTIARIGHEKYMNENYIKSQFLKNLILGHGMPFLLPKERLDSLSEKYKSSCYAVLLVKIQSIHDITENRLEEEFNIYRFTICNLADEIFGENYRCKTVDLDEDMVAVLLMLDNCSIPDNYILCFNKLKEFTRDNVGIILSGSLGCIVDDQNEIYISYQKANQYMKVSNLIGKNELINSNNISNISYQEKNQKLVESIIEYTQLNYINPDLSLKSISQMFNLSTTYVGKIFKSIQGSSYSSYLTNYRLEESKIQLMETSKTVNEIASELGFTNSTYFTTVFKNTFGMTPTIFRNRSNI